MMPLNNVACTQGRIVEVLWCSPSFSQIKINIDGAARGSPELAGYGGIFRDHMGLSVGCFAGHLGLASALEAELQAVIHAVNFAWQKGWHNIWIECDSSLAVLFLANSKPTVSWRHLINWLNCCSLLLSMQVKVSHIFREGNQVADCLANFGVDHVGVHWWDACPPCASTAYCRDLSGFPNYRFK